MPDPDEILRTYGLDINDPAHHAQAVARSLIPQADGSMYRYSPGPANHKEHPMPTPPERYKTRDQWTATDWLRTQHDPAHKPETDEYRAAVRTALADAGLEVEHEAEADPGKMTAEQFLHRLQGAS